MGSLSKIKASNFLSLKDVTVSLGPLNVLVGPNGAGKTNFLSAIKFLGDTARNDLIPAIETFGGFDSLRFRGSGENAPISLSVEAQFTKNASNAAPDEYTLTITQRRFRKARLIQRTEQFVFKRMRGRGRRITISGETVQIVRDKNNQEEQSLSLKETSAGLSTLRKLGRSADSEEIERLAILFETFRVFEVDVRAARQPSPQKEDNKLAHDARNLAAFLSWMHRAHRDAFESIVDDMKNILPGFKNIRLIPIGGASEGISIAIEEDHLSGTTPLTAASFGTIRSLALLAMLHDPEPPMLTCVEEIDHGLHPYALDRIVERLREATTKTQIIVATHSPALVNRMRPNELIVCERDKSDGSSIIPAISSDVVAKMEEESGLALGELWFSGSLGGTPE